MIEVCDYCSGEVIENYQLEVAVCSECGAIEPDTTTMTEEEFDEL